MTISYILKYIHNTAICGGIFYNGTHLHLYELAKLKNPINDFSQKIFFCYTHESTHLLIGSEHSGIQPTIFAKLPKLSRKELYNNYIKKYLSILIYHIETQFVNMINYNIYTNHINNNTQNNSKNDYIDTNIYNVFNTGLASCLLENEKWLKHRRHLFIH